MSIFFIVLMIGTVVGLLAVGVAGLLLPVVNIKEDDDEDDSGHDGGDEGFTPDPWGPTGNYNPIEEHEEELTCQ